MLKVGLTSSIGCGKTEVAKMLRQKGFPIVDCDEIVTELYKRDKNLQKKLQRAFGKNVVKRGKVDRKFLAKVVFAQRQKLKPLNKIVHPSVLKELRRKFATLRRKKVVISVVPLLFESGWQKYFDFIVVIWTNPKKQLQRIMASFHLSRHEALQRINSQLPLSDKVKLADFLIDNNSSLSQTRLQVNLLADILRRIA